MPDDAHVVKLYLATSCGSALESHALYITEYFNPIIDDGAFVTGTIPDGLPSVQVDVAPTGSVELATGRPLLADYVLTQRGVRLVDNASPRELPPGLRSGASEALSARSAPRRTSSSRASPAPSAPGGDSRSG